MQDEYGKYLKQLKEDIINSLEELSCTDLQEIRYIAKEIVDRRLNNCKKIERKF